MRRTTEADKLVKKITSENHQVELSRTWTNDEKIEMCINSMIIDIESIEMIEAIEQILKEARSFLQEQGR